MNQKCLEPCFINAPDGRVNIRCCFETVNNNTTWTCTSGNSSDTRVGPPPDKYQGIEHDEICADLGITVFDRNGWTGTDKVKPFGEIRTPLIAGSSKRSRG